MSPLDAGQLRLAYESIGGIVATLAEMPPDVEAAETISNLADAMGSLAANILRDENLGSEEDDGDALGKSFVLLAKALLHLRISGGARALHSEIQAFLRGFGYPDIPEAPVSGEEVDRG